MNLDEMVKRIGILAERVKSDPAEAEWFEKRLRAATLTYECIHCGELTQASKDECAECEKAPTCERCHTRCIDGLADTENGWCDLCRDEMERPDREAARATWPGRQEPETVKDARRVVDAVLRGWVQ